MTNIQPTSIPSYFNGIGNISPLSGNSSATGQSASQQNDDIFGGAVSLNLSYMALSSLTGDSDGSDGGESDTDILDSLTYSNFSPNTQTDDDSDLDGFLGSLANGGTAPVVPTSLSGPNFEQAVFADGGPLPAFLSYVDKQMNLSPTQEQSLENIAVEFQNVNDTPQGVAGVAAALQQAGIPETI